MAASIGLSNFNKSKVYKNPRDEWYTPRWLINFFTRGDFEKFTDPATTKEVATKHGFVNFFTEENDGLLGEWKGHIWCNPPFSKKDDFIKKVVST